VPSKPGASRPGKQVPHDRDDRARSCYAADPNASADSPGLSDYLMRVADWISGRNANRSPFAPRTEGQQSGDDSTYSQMFGELDALHNAKVAAANKAGQLAADWRTAPGYAVRMAGRKS